MPPSLVHWLGEPPIILRERIRFLCGKPTTPMRCLSLRWRDSLPGDKRQVQRLVVCLPQLLDHTFSRRWISLWRHAEVKPTTRKTTEQALIQASGLPFHVHPRPVRLLHTETGAIAPTKSPPAPINHQNFTGTPKRS